MSYLLDSNIFISAKNTFYNPTFHPGYWELLGRGIKTGDVVIIDRVYKELSAGNDYLATWIKGYESNVLSTKRKDIETELKKISNFVMQNSAWVKGKKDFLEGADAWLIALSQLDDATIVTDEKPNDGKAPKIPIVARSFGCRCIGHITFLKEIRPKFVLDPNCTVFQNSCNSSS